MGESEDTMLLILRQIYAGIGVFSDDRLGGGGSADPASSLPPSSSTFVTSPPGAQPLSKSQSYSSLPPSFPTLPPPPTPYSPPSVALGPPQVPFGPPQIPLGPSTSPAAGVLGMDPTVPMERTGPLPPPPTMGFTR